MAENKDKEFAQNNSAVSNDIVGHSDLRDLFVSAIIGLAIESVLMILLYQQSMSLTRRNDWLEVTQLPGASVADLLINRLVFTIWHSFVVTAGIQIVLLTSIIFVVVRVMRFFVRRRVSSAKT